MWNNDTDAKEEIICVATIAGVLAVVIVGVRLLYHLFRFVWG